MVSKFKMAASDLVSVRGKIMEYTYIPTGIKGEMVRSGVDSHWKGQVIGTVGRRHNEFYISECKSNLKLLKVGHFNYILM